MKFSTQCHGIKHQYLEFQRLDIINCLRQIFYDIANNLVTT